MFVNRGDRNFFEYGMLVDSEHSSTEFQVLYCRPYDEQKNKYQFAELTVDITDSWLQEKSKEVLDYIGQSTVEEDPVAFAIGAVDYFGPENFGATSCYAYNWADMDRESIYEILKYRLIASDNLDMPWLAA